jgi:hypothetical protein
LLLLAACGHPATLELPDGGHAAADGAHAGDATAGDANPSIDAPSLIADAGTDGFVAACDTVTSDRTVASGDVVTTCLSSDADVDTYRFTAPNDAAGGLLRMKLDFEDCQISFALWLDSDPSYPIVYSDDSFDTMYVGQLDHNLIQTTAPGTAYHLVVGKRRPFTGSCGYTLTTSYAAIADKYEPNNDGAPAAPIVLGVDTIAYMACVTASSEASVSDCQDNYTISLPAGPYEMSLSLPSPPSGINPGLSVSCTANGQQTYSYFVFQPEYGEPYFFGASFDLAVASQCYASITGSSEGYIRTGSASPAAPSPPSGADTPYTFHLAVRPPQP